MLEGDLTDFTMPDVLRLLAFTSKTGRLRLVDGDRQGRIDLVDGRVRDASADARSLPLARRALGAGIVDGDTLLAVLGDVDTLPSDVELARALVTDGDVEAGALAQLLREQTYDATFDLLRWTRGSFRFSVDHDASRDGTVLDLAVPVDELLAETARRLEDWPALAGRTGDLHAVVSVRGPRGDAGEVALSAEGWSLLALVDGRRTLGELVTLSGQGEQRTRRALAALLDAGVVEVGAAGGGGPIERLLRDHAALAERERALDGSGPPASTAPSTAPSATSSPAPSVGGDAPEPAPAAPAADLEFEIATDPAPDAEPVSDVASGPDVDPVSEPAIEQVADAAPVPAADDATSARPTVASPRQLRTRVRSDRLRTDPTVDEDLVDRLIDGVEGL